VNRLSTIELGAQSPFGSTPLPPPLAALPPPLAALPPPLAAFPPRVPAAAAWLDLAPGDPLPGWPVPRDEAMGKGRVAAEPTEAAEDADPPVPGDGDTGAPL